MNQIERGRQHIYELYSNPENKQTIANAVKKYRDLDQHFEETYNLYANGAEWTYSITSHKWIKSQALSKIDHNFCKRDHIVYRISKLSEDLFKGNFQKATDARAYLEHKLLSYSQYQTTQEYINGNEYPDDAGIPKFNDKLEDHEFKSAEAKKLAKQRKQEKHEYRQSDAYKIQQLSNEINALENEISAYIEQKLHGEFTVQSKYEYHQYTVVHDRKELIEDAIQIANERQLKPISDNGRNILEKLVSGLNTLYPQPTGQLSKKALSEIEFQEIFPEGVGYRNFFENQYLELKPIDAIHALLTGLNEKRQELAQLKSELHELQKSQVEELPQIQVNNEKVKQKKSFIFRLFSSIVKFFVSAYRWFINLFR